MSALHVIGMLAAIALIVGTAVWSGMKGKKKAGGNGTGVVAGVIMGTLVGGSSTIGTAQLAYYYGMSAWWFTLGGGIGCLILALVYAKPLRASGNPTLVGVIRQEYGPAAGLTASILSSVGTFINIISQLLAASAVVILIKPDLPPFAAVLLSAGFMVLYVVFGGVKSAGAAGLIKLVLLYVSMVVCGVLALSLSGGLGALRETVRGFCAETGVDYFSVFARGPVKDIGAALSLVFGVLTTQTYAQGVLSGRTDRAARRGALASALLIPPIGIFGILVGLYMRSVTDPAVFSAKTALTRFVLDQLPPLPGGVVLGALFIASVGTGAGLALGIATVLGHDIIGRFTKRFEGAKKALILQRGLIVVILFSACFLSSGTLGDIILNFAFLSMGLRGAVIFAPLIGALWFKGRIPPMYALIAVIAGPAVVIAGTLLGFAIDPLIIGIAAALGIMAAGLAAGRGRAGAPLPR